MRHSVESCSKHVQMYSKIHNKNWPILGWVPPMNMDEYGINKEEVKTCAFGDISKIDINSWPKLNENEMKWIDKLSENFSNNIDFDKIKNLVNRV